MGLFDLVGGLFGGSGSSAKSTATIDTSLAVNALARNVMSCASTNMVSQTFVVSGSNNIVQNTKQVQALQFNSSCAQSTQNIAELQQTITNAIQQAANAQSTAVLSVLGGSRSDVDTKISNDVKQNITQETIQNIVHTSAAQQSIIISGNNNIINNFDQSQTLSIVLNNCQNVINNLRSVQDINNALNSNSTATTTNPISEIVDSVFSGITSFGWMWVIIIVVAIAVGGYILVKGGPMAAFLGSDSDEGEDNTQEIQPMSMNQPMQPMPTNQEIQQTY